MFQINDSLIPSCTNSGQLKNIVENTEFEYVMVKMGDIFSIKKIVGYIHHHHKKIMLHLDSLKGIAKDKAGLTFLKKIGVDAIITMKSQQVKMIKESGIVAILGCFIIDSASLQLAMQNIKTNKPDAMIVMPMTVPDEVYRQLMENCSLPILAGGLGMSKEIVEHTLKTGVKACAITDLSVMEGSV